MGYKFKPFKWEKCFFSVNTKENIANLIFGLLSVRILGTVNSKCNFLI